MKVFSNAKGFYRLSKNAPLELLQKEFDRLRALTIYGETGDVKLVCQAFVISRATLYRWLKRFDPKGLTSLKEESRLCHNLYLILLKSLKPQHIGVVHCIEST